jgi:amidase
MGKMIGVPRHISLNDSITENDPSVNIAFEHALEVIKRLGATVVDPADLPFADRIVTTGSEDFVLEVDFKVWSILFVAPLYIAR